MAVYPAALDLPHALMEWVTLLFITREGDRRCKPSRPSPRVALVYLRGHPTLAKVDAGCGISESTAHAYTSAVVDLLAERAPGLLKTLQEHEPECDQVGDGRADDLTAARTNQIIRICQCQGVSILADLAYQGAGTWLTTGIKRRPLQELTPTEKTFNQALAAARAPVKRGVARLKSWRIFRRSDAAPTA